MYDPDGIAARIAAQNAWMRQLLPGAAAERPVASRAVAAPRVRMTALLPILAVLESVAKRLQLRRFPERITALMNRDTRVVVTDDVLKFHVDDRRAEFERGFRECLARLAV
jgi:hypothetical protein